MPGDDAQGPSGRDGGSEDPSSQGANHGRARADERWAQLQLRSAIAALGPQLRDVNATLAGFDTFGPSIAKLIESQQADLHATLAGFNTFGPSIAKLIESQRADLSTAWARMALISAPAFQALAGVDWAALERAVEAARRRDLPPNLHQVSGLRVEVLETLANEGLTLWSVPRHEVAAALISAPDAAARRRILGSRSEVILDDCADVAALASSGSYGTHAGFLAQAISAIRSGHVAAGQALVASTLDSTLQASIDKTARSRLTQHLNAKKRIDHFQELELAAAMVFRPIWQAYRPQNTPAERAASWTFARHGIAHNVSGRQFNRRNAVQGAMLAASLLNFVTFWRNEE